MSWKVVRWVRKHSPARDAQRSVLVVLGEHARHDGTNAKASVATIAREAKLHPRTVKRALRHLENGQQPAIEKTGVTDRGVFIYRVVMDDAAGSDATPGVAYGHPNGQMKENSSLCRESSTSKVDGEIIAAPGAPRRTLSEQDRGNR